MNKYPLSAILILFFFLICGTVPVLANGNPCEDSAKQVQSFVSSLNNKMKAQAGKGLFEVKPIEQEGMITRWSVTYKLSGHALFLQDVVTDRVKEALEVSANIFSGQSSLIFIYSFGAGGAIGCGYAVFPQEGRFTALEIPYPFLIEDFDHDNNVELQVLEQEQWGSDCAPTRAYIPYWPRIFRLDPQSGKLVDISKQFPGVYLDSLKKYEDDYKWLKEQKYFSQECSKLYSQFLERLKQASLKTNIEWKTLNKEVEDLYNAGQYDRAVDVAKKALALAEKNVGPDHPDVAESLSTLARLYFVQGQYAQAEPLAKRALAICEKTLGPDHPDVAASLTNLAALYRKQGQYAQAEPLLKRALAIREKTLGPDHPDVAASLSNLAVIYHIQKQYAQAEPLYKRALQIWEKALGPDHPTVVATRKNLTALYQAIKREQETGGLEQQEPRISKTEVGRSAVVAQTKTSAKKITNDDIISLVKGGLSDSAIISVIHNSETSFDLSPSALLQLKAKGVSNTVIETMVTVQQTSSTPSKNDALPTSYGFYVFDGNELNNLNVSGITSVIGLQPGGPNNLINGFAVDGFRGNPSVILTSNNPVFIFYQQSINTTNIHFSDLSYVDTMQAYMFNMYGTDPPLFRGLYHRDYYEQIRIDLWRAKRDIPFRVEPVEGKSGMYRIVPEIALERGRRYTIYFGDALHHDDIIFTTKPDQKSYAFYFAISKGVGDSEK